jgi:hypothetical protein
MKVEQPAKLNQYADPTLPLTWTIRWHSLRPSLPLLICSGLLLVEMLAFRLWLNDRGLLSELPLVLTCALMPAALVLAAFEIQVRIWHRTKRTLRLDGNHVSISPTKYPRVSWKQITAWRFHPVEQDPELTLLTMEYSARKKVKWRREWSMILRKPDQVQAVVSELDQFRETGSNTAPVFHFSEPDPPKSSHRRIRGTVALAISWWLLIHGIPLLGVGLLPPPKRTDPAADNSRFTAKELAKIQSTAVRFFSSPTQLRTFALVTGAGITALGGGVYLWGLSRLIKTNSERPVLPAA